MQWTATVRNIQASGSRPQNATIKISLLTRLSESGSGGQSSVTVLCVGREKTKQNKGSRICINTTSLIFSQWWYSRQDMLAILTLTMIDQIFLPYSGKGDCTYYCLLLSESTFWHFPTLRIYWDTIVNRHLNRLPWPDIVTLVHKAFTAWWFR